MSGVSSDQPGPAETGPASQRPPRGGAPAAKAAEAAGRPPGPPRNPAPQAAPGSPQAAQAAQAAQTAQTAPAPAPAAELTLEDLVAQLSAGLQIFMVAIKNSSLYPANSKIRQESMTRLAEWLGAYVEEHESVRLFVNPESLLFHGVVVHQDKPGEPNVIFPLFRDGLQWIEFQEGLALEDLETFIGLVNRFRQLREEDEDDLVTAMWAAGFEFIKYKTANEFWDIDPLTEIAAFRAGPGDGTGGGPGLAEKGSKGSGKGVVALLAEIDALEKNDGQGKRNSSFKNVRQPGRSGSGSYSGAGQEEDLALFAKLGLTEDERAEIRKLLARETGPRPLMEVLEPALVLLWRLRNLAQAGPVVTFLAEAAKFNLAAGHFSEIHSLRSLLGDMSAKGAGRLDGVLGLFDKKISSRETLEGLAEFRLPDGASKEERARSEGELAALLACLPPGAAPALVAVCAQARDRIVPGAILKTLASLPEGLDPGLGQLINSTLPVDQVMTLARHLARRLEAGRGETPAGRELLAGLSRHVDNKVREAAGLLLLDQNPEHIGLMPHLLNEPDPGLCRKVYALLAGARSKGVEKSVLSFLRQIHDTNTMKPTELLMNCWRTLGLSAVSSQAADFAEGVLMKKDLRALLGLGSEHETSHRAGAAMALRLMGRGEIVDSAASSFYKDLRRACRLADQALADFAARR
ncbi:MAG: hypothetical protein LBP95_05395 [Deltaproteobacteria bacterium]|nr:hypothetical protein [Deltaproteobacteria bacterium]